jgi:hypothetical protein
MLKITNLAMGFYVVTLMLPESVLVDATWTANY